MKKIKRCGECGKPLEGPVRFCGLCKRPMKRGDKWVINGSRLEHRDCKNPNNYGRPA